jgi:hypothetical protein
MPRLAMVTVVVVVTMLPVMAMGCSEFLQHRLLMLGNDDLKNPPQPSPERAARHQREDGPRQNNISWIVARNPRQHCHGKAAQAKTAGGNGDQVWSRVLHHSQCRSAATAPGTAVRGFGPSAAALKRSAQQHRDFLEVLEISDAGRSGIASDLPPGGPATATLPIGSKPALPEIRLSARRAPIRPGETNCLARCPPALPDRWSGSSAAPPPHAAPRARRPSQPLHPAWSESIDRA